MPDGLLTLTMTRETFPYFKRLLESNRLVDGEDEVQLTVDEESPGVIRLTAARWYGSQERG